MPELSTGLRFSLILAGLCALVALMFALVRWARGDRKGARAVGAVLILFGWANLRDPRNDTVAEAQEGRIRRGEESGDPPSS